MEIHDPFSYVFTPSQTAASEQNILQGLLYVALLQRVTTSEKGRKY